jgi:choline-sulfatase
MLVILAALTAASTALLAQPASAAGPSPPNVLLIITDQQHAGMMSCTGNRWLETPHLDALAARGVRFERAYCGNPVCVPSRLSMMTGVLPSRIGMEHNEPAAFPVPQEILQHALGHAFQRAGYRTLYGGKVHLPGTRQEGIAAYGFGQLTADERDGLAQTCARFFQQQPTQPFLLVASFINPHDICYMAIDAFTQSAGRPLMYPHSHRERQCLADALRLPSGVSRDEFFARRCPPLPSNFEIPIHEPPAVRENDWREFRQFVQDHWAEEDWRLHRWAYARLTEKVDQQIGQVLDALRDAGLQDNTLVVFTSDHGDMDSAHRLEHKSVPYEEAIRVPLIIRPPGGISPGIVDQSHLVSTGLDLIPTLCDFAGIPCPPGLAGRSLRPLTQTDDQPPPWRPTLVVETHHSRVLHSDQYKYVACDDGQPREMLIDLTADPGEMNNLAVDPQYAQALAQHRQWLRQWYQENGETLAQQFIVAPERVGKKE